MGYWGGAILSNDYTRDALAIEVESHVEAVNNGLASLGGEHAPTDRYELLVWLDERVLIHLAILDALIARLAVVPPSSGELARWRSELEAAYAGIREESADEKFWTERDAAVAELFARLATAGEEWERATGGADNPA